MFELSQEQLQIISILVSPFGLVLIIQALRHVLAWRGVVLPPATNTKVVRAFVWVWAIFLAYVWVLPAVPLPELPACTAETVNDCLVAIPAFVAAWIVAIGYLYIGATQLFDGLARPLFEALKLGAPKA